MNSSETGILGRRPWPTAFLDAVASVATVIALIGITVALFFNPLWIGFGQERAGVPAITGYTPEEVRGVTGSILADVMFGPPAFAAVVNGRPVLDAAERSHMVDVHNVLRVFGGIAWLAIVSLVTIVGTGRWSRWVWRAIARGSSALVLVGNVDRDRDRWACDRDHRHPRRAASERPPTRLTDSSDGPARCWSLPKLRSLARDKPAPLPGELASFSPQPK